MADAAEPTSALKAAFWVRAGQEKHWEFSQQLQLRFLWRRLHHIRDPHWHNFSSILQHALSLEWQRQHTVCYPIPFCWWLTYPRISCWMLNGGFSLESEWFHFTPCVSFCWCLTATKTYLAVPWVQSNSSGNLLCQPMTIQPSTVFA